MSKRLSTTLSVSIVLVVFFLVGCGRSASRELAMEEQVFAAAESADFEFTEDTADISFQTSSEIPQSRLIIRTADMAIVVTDTEAAMGTIARLVEENGGWVVSSSQFQSGTGSSISGSMTVRVPATGFDDALEAIRMLALEVSRLETSGQDVTEEYVDLSARLSNLEATAERVRGFLDETKNVEEALAVNQELSRLEGEIEVLKGRLQYLEQSAAFSTITVRLTPDELSQPIEVAGWKPEGVARDAVEALIGGLQFIASALIWLVIFCLPFLLILGIPLLLLLNVVRRRRSNRSAVQTGAETGEAPDEDESTT